VRMNMYRKGLRMKLREEKESRLNWVRSEVAKEVQVR
jgi:hypothetical protein